MVLVPEGLVLEMDNSFDGTIVEKDGDLITSHSDKDNHGLGLESVKSVLEKYNEIIASSLPSVLVMYLSKSIDIILSSEKLKP